jgi:MFS family permease
MQTASKPALLTINDYKIIFLSILGGALEVYDFIIFVFLSVTIADVFFPPDVPQWLRLMQSLAIFSVGYLARPAGGLLLAHYSDLLGRKVMFNFTVLFMALPCLAIGLIPTYAHIGYFAPLLLLLARLVQGAALGGEVPNAWVFVAEHVPIKRRGYALGLLQAGLTFGYMLAALTVAILTSVYTPAEVHSWAWRVPFLIGGVFGFIAVWLRRWLRETPVFLAMQKNKTLAEQLPVAGIVKHHGASAIPSILLTIILTSAVITMVVVTPIALQKFYELDAGTTFRISCVAILFMNVGCVVAGLLSDRLGAWKTVGIYSVLLTFGITLLCASFGASPAVILVSYMVACLSSGVIGAVPSVIVQLFPAKLKVTGISLTYNMTYSLGSSLLPVFMLGLLHSSRWGMVMLAVAIGLLGLLTMRIFSKIQTYP